MSVQLDDATMRAAIAKAVLDSITPEKRQELITAAVASVLELEEVKDPHGSYYSTIKRPKIQGMFDEAVRNVAEKLVVDVVKNDAGLNAKLREMITRVIDGFVAQKQDELAASFASAVSYALLKRSDG